MGLGENLSFEFGPFLKNIGYFMEQVFSVSF